MGSPLNLAIGIAHAGWNRQRGPTLRRLLGQLPEGVYVQVSQQPEHSWRYARNLWRWASKQTADVVCLLNDDVIVCDDFARVVGLMVEANPGEILGLHAQGEAARAHAERGENWCRAYNLTGPGNVATPSQYGALCDYWDSTPDLQCAENVNEDNVASQWAYAIQTPMWLPLPSPLKHDTAVPSTIGYDHHEMRSTRCPWDRYDVAMDDPWTWKLRRPKHLVPWIENPWFPIAALHAQRRHRLFGEGGHGTCVVCEVNPDLARTTDGRGVCGPCLGALTGHVLGQARRS